MVADVAGFRWIIYLSISFSFVWLSFTYTANRIQRISNTLEILTVNVVHISLTASSVNSTGHLVGHAKL